MDNIDITQYRMNALCVSKSMRKVFTHMCTYRTRDVVNLLGLIIDPIWLYYTRGVDVVVCGLYSHVRIIQVRPYAMVHSTKRLEIALADRCDADNGAGL